MRTGAPRLYHTVSAPIGRYLESIHLIGRALSEQGLRLHTHITLLIQLYVQ